MSGVVHGAQGQSEPRFPAVAGKDLNGRSLKLPGHFPAPFSLVLVAFEMRQQDDVDSWHGFVEEARRVRPSLSVFELPTIAGGYRLMQFVIGNGMRSGIRDTETRAATVTLYVDVGAFARSLGIPTTREIAVLVVTPAGRILGQVTGRCRPEAAASILAALSTDPPA